jgi:hypothetical protein
MDNAEREFEMSTWTAALAAAALLTLFVLFLVRVRRIERDVDFAEFTRHADDDDNLALLARIIANTVVASP